MGILRADNINNTQVYLNSNRFTLKSKHRTEGRLAKSISEKI